MFEMTEFLTTNKQDLWNIIKNKPNILKRLKVEGIMDLDESTLEDIARKISNTN
ncbi:hypothetical protein ACWA1F_23705 [Flavobacterium sp. 3-218]